MLKNSVSTRIKEELCEFRFKLFSLFNYFYNYNKIKNLKNKNKILYLMTPTHKNIGDAAIALGAFELFDKLYKDIEVMEFTDYEVQTNRYYIKAISNENDIIFLHGGGNLGDWYPAWELLREDMIRILKNRKVVLMPQTISFGNKDGMDWILKKAIKTYSKYPLYKFICRDKKSYEYAKNVLKAHNLFLMPDTALIMDRCNSSINEDKITFCLRQDIEKNRTTKLEDVITSSCLKYTNCLINTDTIYDKNITPDIRKQIVSSKINEFIGSKLVVTDRYHGVIFSYLAKCPCLVLGNKDSKVKEAMYYFKGLDYIIFVNDENDIEKAIDSLIHTSTEKSIDYFGKYFKENFINESE